MGEHIETIQQVAFHEDGQLGQATRCCSQSDCRIKILPRMLFIDDL